MILWRIAGGMSRKQKVVLIGLVLANPVYLSQLFTYYILHRLCVVFPDNPDHQPHGGIVPGIAPEPVSRRLGGGYRAVGGGQIQRLLFRGTHNPGCADMDMVERWSGKQAVQIVAHNIVACGGSLGMCRVLASIYHQYHHPRTPALSLDG